MSKFKPGDNARVLQEIPILGYKGGEVVIVRKVHGECVFIEGKYPNGHDPVRGLAEHKLGPVPKRDYVADHARRTLRKAGLSAEEARKVVQYWGHPECSLSALSRNLPAPLSALLVEAFTWKDTAEGSHYWSSIQKREYEKERNAKAQ